MTIPQPNSISWQETDQLWVHANLATMDPKVPSPYGALHDYALAVRGGRILGLWPSQEIELSGFPGKVQEAKGQWITPGFIDCHTHLIHAGSRAAEWEMRLAGQSYVEIAKQGGGILSTVRATRQATEDTLFRLASERLQGWLSEGVTCIEIKSGYGLSVEDELKMLRVIRRLKDAFPVEISPTLLAAHAIPPEFQGRADDYVQLIVKELIPRVRSEGLAEAVDVFCESIAFNLDQSERLWQAAQDAGLAIKGHVEQLSNLKGTISLAQRGAWSADHLEYLDRDGIAALSASSTVAVLLPGAFYFLRESRKPPVPELRKARVANAVATDFNPGTSPFASLRLAMNQACVLYGLSSEEALAGVTRVAAQALNRADRMGKITAGYLADLAVWKIDHPAEVVCELGTNRMVSRVYRGQVHHVSG